MTIACDIWCSLTAKKTKLGATVNSRNLQVLSFINIDIKTHWIEPILWLRQPEVEASFPSFYPQCCHGNHCPDVYSVSTFNGTHSM